VRGRARSPSNRQAPSFSLILILSPPWLCPYEQNTDYGGHPCFPFGLLEGNLKASFPLIEHGTPCDSVPGIVRVPPIEVAPLISSGSERPAMGLQAAVSTDG